MTLSKCNWRGLKVEWGGGEGGAEGSWQRLIFKHKHAPHAMSAGGGAGGCGVRGLALPGQLRTAGRLIR